MLKKCVLLCVLCLPSTLNSMIRVNWPLTWRDDLIADFGVLRNATQNDKNAHLLYMDGQEPITLVADNFNRENRLRALSQILDTECGRYESRNQKIMMGEQEDIKEKLMNSHRLLFTRILDAAAVCHARGTFCKPDYEEFRKIMAGVVAKIAYEPCRELNKQLVEVVSELRVTKAMLQNRQSESLAMKHELNRLGLDLAIVVKNNQYNINLLAEAVSAMNDLEKERDGLNARAEHQERLLQNAEKEIQKSNQELQKEKEKYAKERLEKTKLVERFEQEIKQIAADAIQRQGHASTAIARLRKEISPLRRELSPLRRQVKAQEEALSEKNAEIARLRQALVQLQDSNK